MASFGTIPREETIRAWREWYAERNVGQRQKPRNAAPVVYLTEPFRVPAMGRMWLVPPVPVPEAIRVQAIMDRLDDLRGWETDPARRAEGRQEYAAILCEAVDLIPRLVEPYEPHKRRVWWLRKRFGNPFRKASEADLVELLLAFSLRRRMGPDRQAQDERGLQLTTSTDALRSPTTSLRGAAPAVFHSRGVTTATGSRTSNGKQRGKS